jgi:hypothetical protein
MKNELQLLKIKEELTSVFPSPEIRETLELIKQKNLDGYPANGSVSQLKKEQFILEHLTYLFYDGKEG